MIRTHLHMGHLVFILMVILPTWTLAQQINQIKANVLSTDQEVIELGNIIIRSVKDSSLIFGDVFYDGKIDVSYTNQDVAILEISALGYEAYSLALNNVLSASQIDTIYLTPKAWETVTITANQKLVEKVGPNLKVNVANTPLQHAGTALDAIQNAPKLIVDRNGQIQVLGKGNALIYLDGQQVASNTILSSLPSTDIASIEIIENPSAMYDASGNAVIHIKTRNKNIEGYKLGLTQEIGHGKHFRSFFQSNAYLKLSKWMFQGDYGIRPQTIGNQFIQERTFLANEDNFYTHNHYILDNKWVGHNYAFRSSFSPNKQHTMGIHYVGTYGTAEKRGDNYRFSTIGNGVANFDISTLVLGSTAQKSNTLTGHYNFESATGSQTLQISAQYADFGFNRNETSDQDFESNSMSERIYRASTNENKIKIYTAQADYTRKLNENWNITSGIKNATIQNESSVRLSDIIDENTLEPLEDFSNAFDYQENILAAYGQLEGSIASIDMHAGLRVEHTTSMANSDKLNTNNNLNRRYTKAFPSVSISTLLAEKYALQLSYNYRINRPLFQDLNPYVLYVDSLVSLSGNPNLVPEYGHNIAVGLSFDSWSFDLSYVYIKNKVNQIFRSLDPSNPNSISFVKENLLFTELYSAQVSRPFTYKGYSANFILGGFFDNHQTKDISDILANQKAGFYFQINQFFKLPWAMQGAAYARYTSARVDGIYIDNPMSFINVSLSKNFFHDQLTVRLWANDILDRWKFTGIAAFNNMEGTYLSEGDWHFAKIVFQWNFGKLGTRAFSKKKISDEELGRINTWQ